MILLILSIIRIMFSILTVGPWVIEGGRTVKGSALVLRYTERPPPIRRRGGRGEERGQPRP